MKLFRISLIALLNLVIFKFAYPQARDSVVYGSGEGLKGITMEVYARHPLIASVNTVGVTLPAGYVTYRVFVDMAPGYKLQAIYGIPAHPLQIETVTTFYNNQDFGGKCGDEINETLLNSFNTAFDTWISMGAATGAHYGIAREEDYDGSLLNYTSFEKSDGLIGGSIPNLRFFRFMPDFFQHPDSSSFVIHDGAWVVYEGVWGMTSSNRVLVAQLTTDGAITLKLNVQLVSPRGEIEQFVYENPIDHEFLHPSLQLNRYKAKDNDHIMLTNHVSD
jgi:hypothetical protein